MRHFLDFEKPLAELEGKIEELRKMSEADGMNIADEVTRLIDKADKLDPKGRNGLFNLLAEAGIKAVVATMMARPNLVPDLEGAEIGASYWLKDGIAIPRAEAIQPIKQAAE